MGPVFDLEVHLAESHKEIAVFREFGRSCEGHEGRIVLPGTEQGIGKKLKVVGVGLDDLAV